MKKILIIAILAASVILLLTCDNGFNILDEVETEVKIANDKFLVIKSVSPADLSTNVNPGNEINIVFDRNINTGTITSGTLSVYNETLGSEYGFNSFNFNTTTKVLKVEPTDDFFENSTDYTITVYGIRGEDGSELQNETIWSFATGIAPAGSIQADDRSGFAVSGYTNEAYVDVSVTSSNPYADDYFISVTESDVTNPGSIPEVDWQDVATDSSDFPITDTEGAVTIYCVFRGVIGIDMAYSQTETVEMILDKTDPLVEAGNNRISNGTITQIGSATEENLYSWQWSGAGLSFGSPASPQTTISASSDGTYTATLTVTDKAGNTFSDTMQYERDTLDPSPPDVTGPGQTSPTTDTTPTFSWASTASDGSGYFDGRYYAYSSENHSGDWTYSPGVTKATEYSPSVTVSGIDSVLVTMWVREQDKAGNWSDFDYDPSGQALVSNFIPYNTQAGVSTLPTFDWPSVKFATYDLQLYNTFLQRWDPIAADLTTSSYKLSKDDELSNNHTYIWRVATSSGTLRPTYSDALTFTTEP